MNPPDQPPFDPEAVPTEAVVSRGGRDLRLTWANGEAAVLPSETLRLRCRCAWCTRDRIESRFPAAFPAVAVTRIDPLGGYAVNLGFSDGHARGIFPWVYLRDLAREAAAPRPAATAERTPRAA
ncbi:MAG TPA: DUF971 domain-containing protein [Devosia sp.]|jgi:DUF971 family protein|uniref:DUF971 domain-containing protein n=1 Tax=Methylorubrum extorquens TaxID=408 RepID=UPI0022376D14|nr:DUF971 domain-containing protein [Methylorubrum extorquens]UYW27534.1 DUF971 domain-containing protein [Methylorubrum extorquens]HZY69012.1 DUF971 domain-containing protein [Devosia sp.]